MEVTLDVKLSYSVNGVDEIVRGMDLMSKFKGANVSCVRFTNKQVKRHRNNAAVATGSPEGARAYDHGESRRAHSADHVPPF